MINKLMELENALNKGNIGLAHSILNNNLLNELIDSNAYSKETLLHKMCEKGNLEAVKWLIEKESDINAKDNQGKTPILRAYNSNLKQPEKESILTFLFLMEPILQG